MAVSLSRFAVHGAKQTEADRLAKEYAAQQKRASKRGLFSGMLGKVGGKLLGGAITGFLGLTGIGAPIGMALGNLLAKKGAHELTGAMGMGADPSKLASKSKYGYGESEAKTLRAGLEEQMAKDPMRDPGGFGKELLGSYVSAGMSGALKGTLKDFGKPGTIFKEGGPKTLGERFTAGKAGLEEAFGAATSWGGEEPDIAPSDYVPTPGGGQYNPITGDELDEEGWSIVKEEGGLVPKYYGGGKVQDKAPTISEYFNMQGVSLGGSHIQSVAQMLGRK